jgi:hypothetical protein
MLPVDTSYSPRDTRYDDNEEWRVYGDFEEDEELDDDDEDLEDEDEDEDDEEFDELEDEFDEKEYEPRRGKRSDWEQEK